MRNDRKCFMFQYMICRYQLNHISLRTSWCKTFGRQAVEFQGLPDCRAKNSKSWASHPRYVFCQDLEVNMWWMPWISWMPMNIGWYRLHLWLKLLSKPFGDKELSSLRNWRCPPHSVLPVFVTLTQYAKYVHQLETTMAFMLPMLWCWESQGFSHPISWMVLSKKLRFNQHKVSEITCLRIHLGWMHHVFSHTSALMRSVNEGIISSD